MSDVVRIGSSISFHLSKLSNAKFSILYDIFSGERLKEKIMADHYINKEIKKQWPNPETTESKLLFSLQIEPPIPQLLYLGHPLSDVSQIPSL